MCYNESRLTKKEYIDLEVSLILQAKKKRAVGYISDTIHVTV